MNIISVNSGSSSIKLQLFEMPEEKVIAKFGYERVTFENTFVKIQFDNEVKRLEFNKSLSHQECIAHIC